MNEQEFNQWEERARDTARTLSYPPTPDFSAAVSPPSPVKPWLFSRPRSALALGIVLVLVGALAVPPVRARIREVLRIGTIRILPAEPTTAPVPATSAPAHSATIVSATPRPTPTLTTSLLPLEGETTLEDAQQRVSFPIRLPTTPRDLGPPDKVFLQELGGAVLIVVWLEPGASDQVRLSLHQFGPDTFAEKIAPRVVETTTVGGTPAIWAKGPYLLRVRGADGDGIQEQRLVNGHVLIWTEGAVTYRLETMLTMEEAIEIAESVR